MPTEIEGFAEITQDEFDLMVREARKSTPSYIHPSMVALMSALAENEQPYLIKLKETQTSRAVRSAIMNVARHRGLKVQSVSGEGYVAVRRLGFIADEEEEFRGEQGH
jgi:hypothetical protein